MAAGRGIANYHAPNRFDWSTRLDTATRPDDLALRLRTATRELHTAVERTGVMAALLHGRLERAGYVALVRNLHAVYAALESALAAQADADLLQALRLGPLARAGALAADLSQLHGPGWPLALPLAPATGAYVARLHAADPPALVAHAYVRYLGDLSGGQVLAQLVARRYGLTAGEGTRFYDFGAPDQALALKQDFRAALSSLLATPDEADAIVEEACWAFRQHQRLFEQLA